MVNPLRFLGRKTVAKGIKAGRRYMRDTRTNIRNHGLGNESLMKNIGFSTMAFFGTAAAYKSVDKSITSFRNRHRKNGPTRRF